MRKQGACESSRRKGLERGQNKVHCKRKEGVRGGLGAEKIKTPTKCTRVIIMKKLETLNIQNKMITCQPNVSQLLSNTA